ncbi:3-phosphoshikimate 1-carboxyvinyltransferase [Helicobacter sp. 23-1046]
MRNISISASKKFHCAFDAIAPDKSISHRVAMFALLSNGKCEVQNYLLGEDTLDTLKIAQSLGLEVKQTAQNSFIFTPQSTDCIDERILEPRDILNCGNAGTAMRLYTGLLSGIKGYFVLSGDKYLNARPMRRIVEPLSSIGASIYGREGSAFAPLTIIGKHLQNFSYESKISSAQVKSAMILAGLFAGESGGENTFSEPLLSRDHTERILQAMGVNFTTSQNAQSHTLRFQSLPKNAKLQSFSLTIPADPSSAFYFALAACIVPDSCVVIENILLNPTRIEAYKVLEKMGAKISYHLKSSHYEDIGDIEVRYAPLKAVNVSENISWLIDEIPALAIAFACANGKSKVCNAKELRVKESDRIASVVEGLRAMGIECEEFEDGFSVQGGELKSGTIDSHGDHRIAMSFAIGALLCGAKITDTQCIDTSFPNFLELLGKITTVTIHNA